MRLSLGRGGIPNRVFFKNEQKIRRTTNYNQQQNIHRHSIDKVESKSMHATTAKNKNYHKTAQTARAKQTANDTYAGKNMKPDRPQNHKNPTGRGSYKRHKNWRNHKSYKQDPCRPKKTKPNPKFILH